MDHWWTDHYRWMEPKLDEAPSTYFKRQFWATFEDDRAGILTRELIGVDRLMWRLRLSAYGRNIPPFSRTNHA